MKVLTGISSIILMLSVGSLDSAGAWWLLPLAAGACSLAVLFFTCGRLGFFGAVRGDDHEQEEPCQVIWLSDRVGTPPDSRRAAVQHRREVSSRSAR